jgi:hypothetical protein
MKRSSVGQISCTVAMATILITCITIVIIAAVVVIAGDILINVALQERRIDRNGVMMMAFTWRSWLSRDSQVPKILMMTFPCRTWLSQDSQVPKILMMIRTSCLVTCLVTFLSMDTEIFIYFLLHTPRTLYESTQ